MHQPTTEGNVVQINKMKSYHLHERNRKLPNDGVIAPIALFFIILGIQAVILYRIVDTLELFSPEMRDIFLHSSWFVAGIPASIYSLFRLKALLKSTTGDKILYFLLPFIFIIMMGVGVVNLIK